MRSSLLGSLLQVLKFNLDRKAPRVNVFELGRVFLRDAQVQNTDTTVAGFSQPMRVAGLAYGPRASLNWSQSDKAVDFFDIKGDVEALLAPLQAVFVSASHPAMAGGRFARPPAVRLLVFGKTQQISTVRGERHNEDPGHQEGRPPSRRRRRLRLVHVLLYPHP